MKKGIIMTIAGILAVLSLCSCGSSSSRSKSSNYDYDKGYGYTAPKKNESLSDYIKRQDPDLYNDMQKRWDSLK